MRVIILVPSLPLKITEIKGGVHSALINLLFGFKSKDIQVRVLTFSKEIKFVQKTVYSSNIEIYYEPEGPLPFHSLNYLFKGPSILKKHIKSFNPDILHFQTGNTLLFTTIMGLIGRKYILTIHAFAYEELKTKTSFKDRMTWRFNDFINKIMPTKNVIYISLIAQNKHLSEKIDHYALIPNALTPVFFELEIKKKTDNKLFYVGVFNNRKNIYYLLTILKKLIDNGKIFTLDAIGDFDDISYKKLVMDYIEKNHLEKYVNFNGWVNQVTLLDYIKSSDILVLTSYQETLPMVIAESMASGKVVVSSDVGGIPEMINDNGNGFLFNLNDKDKLYYILSDLHNNSALIEKVSNEARLTAASKYYCDNVAEKTLNFYNECIAN